MSAMAVQNFEAQFALYSYAEQLAVIENLIRLMRQKQEEEKEAVSDRRKKIKDLFALMDAHPVYSNGRKWTREEMHERR